MTQKNEQLIANQTTMRKISFFSAILVVMGSSIGAGIFFKSGSVLSSVQNSLVLAIVSWLIAAASVICMALALVEIASARNDDLSILGWTKTFNSKKTFKAAKNFMFYLYLPLNLFYMPLYVIMSLQDGVGALVNGFSVSPTGEIGGIIPYSFGTNYDWIIWTVISIVISLYFIVISGLFSKIGDIQNKIITYIKFIPLGGVAIIGIILIGMNAGGKIQIGFDNSGMPSIGDVGDYMSSGGKFANIFPHIGMFLSISAIFFAYDGFYVVAGIQTELKEPKKTPLVILIGLIITTIIYLVIAITMSINDGSFSNMGKYMVNQWGDTGRIIYGIINILIAIGILGIINAFSMWMPRYTETLMKEGELPFSYKYKNKLNEHKPKVGVIFSIITTLPLVIIFSIIGALAYIDNYGVGYGDKMDNLYSFADLVANWMSVFIFALVVAAIFGGIINRKNNFVQTKKTKYFLPTAWISSIMIGVSTIITVIVPFIDLIMVVILNENKVNNYTQEIISRSMLVLTLFIIIGLTYGIRFIEDKIYIKKYGSLEKYEQWKEQTFVIS